MFHCLRPCVVAAEEEEDEVMKKRNTQESVRHCYHPADNRDEEGDDWYEQYAPPPLAARQFEQAQG